MLLVVLPAAAAAGCCRLLPAAAAADRLVLLLLLLLLLLLPPLLLTPRRRYDNDCNGGKSDGYQLCKRGGLKKSSNSCVHVRAKTTAAQDCAGGWANVWTGCSARCGPGVQRRLFNASKPAQWGGRACPKTRTRGTYLRIPAVNCLSNSLMLIRQYNPSLGCFEKPCFCPPGKFTTTSGSSQANPICGPCPAGTAKAGNSTSGDVC